jgi:hypothetical protein
VKLQHENIQEDSKDVQDEMGFGMLSSLIIHPCKLISVSSDKAPLFYYQELLEVI